LIVKAQVVSAAREWIGVPFRHQGRTRDGVDCAGVVIKVAHALGLSSFDATGYRRLPAGIGQEKIEDICRREMIPIEEAKARGDDLVLASDPDCDRLGAAGSARAELRCWPVGNGRAPPATAAATPGNRRVAPAGRVECRRGGRRG
jgi:hypothetical protein